MYNTRVREIDDKLFLNSDKKFAQLKLKVERVLYIARTRFSSESAFHRNEGMAESIDGPVESIARGFRDHRHLLL